ncbi:hypothetical protein ABZS79_15905 [Streptomyces griseoloalbus]
MSAGPLMQTSLPDLEEMARQTHEVHAAAAVVAMGVPGRRQPLASAW